MASFFYNMRSAKPGKAADHSLYINREGRHSREDSDLVAQGHENLPPWAHGSSLTYWRTADQNERRNGSVCRKIVLTLPIELGVAENTEVVKTYVARVFSGKTCEWVIHYSNSAITGELHPHAHIMVSDRLPDGIDRPPAQHFRRFNAKKPELGGARKDSGGRSKEEMRQLMQSRRQVFAEVQNEALEAAGLSVRVDARSNKARGINKPKEKHLGYRLQRMSESEKRQLVTQRKMGGSQQLASGV